MGEVDSRKLKVESEERGVGSRSVGHFELCEVEIKPGPSTTRADTFAGANVKEKASARFGRDDSVGFGRGDRFGQGSVTGA